MKFSTLTASLLLAAAFGTSLIPAMANPPRPRTTLPLSRRDVTEIPNNNDVQARQTLKLGYQDYIVLKGAMEPGNSRDVLRVIAPDRLIGTFPIRMNFKLTGPSLGTPFLAYIVKDTNFNGRTDPGEPIIARFNRHNSNQGVQMDDTTSYLFVTQPTQAQNISAPYQVTFIPTRRR